MRGKKKKKEGDVKCEAVWDKVGSHATWGHSIVSNKHAIWHFRLTSGVSYSSYHHVKCQSFLLPPQYHDNRVTLHCSVCSDEIKANKFSVFRIQYQDTSRVYVCVCDSKLFGGNPAS